LDHNNNKIKKEGINIKNNIIIYIMNKDKNDTKYTKDRKEKKISDGTK